MKALLTGGTGFIGSHLAEGLLKRGFEVTCLVRDKHNLKNIQGIQGVRLFEGDCEDADTLKGIGGDFQYVFHLAGLTKAPSRDAFFSANVGAVENLLNALIDKKDTLKRFVHLSSLAAAGPARNNLPLVEDCAMKPVSDYGFSKLKGEETVYSYRHILPVTIIRPPAVYGPRDKDMLVLFKMINHNISLSWGEGLYSFIYIDDLINGIILSALHERAVGEIFFLTDGSVYSHSQVVDAVAMALNKRPIRLRVPGFVIDAIAFLSEKASGLSIINSDKIKELKHPQWICYNSKASEVLGFMASIDLMEGSQRTADWYRKERWL